MITIKIPGSKSYTNRALVMAALTKQSITIRNYLKSDDTEAMIYCLNRIGFDIQEYDDRVEMSKSIIDINKGNEKEILLDCRMSGTTIRFLTALCALLDGRYVLVGEKRLTERPIGDLISALQQLGANIKFSNKEGYPPLNVHGGSIDVSQQHEVCISGKISSQFLSALLMIGPLVGKLLVIDVKDDLVSKTYAHMTIHMMQQWGINVTNTDYKRFVIPANQGYKLNNGEYIVEGDYSSAGYFFAIAALTKRSLQLSNLNANSVQGDKQFAQLLQSHMHLEFIPSGNDVITIGHGVQLVSVNMESCPDQAQTMAVLCAFAKGKSVITGVRSLRVKETERVVAIQNELTKMGIKTESPDIDTLIIHGGTPQPAIIDTYNDHRMAMSFAVAKTKLPTLVIQSKDVVQKTFPDFWKEFAKL